jgi:HSP20 family protein
MANIVRRSDRRGMGADPSGQLGPMSMWDPFQMMRELAALDPYREMARGGAAFGGAFVPSFEVKETRDAYIFSADLPGVDEGDVDVSLSGNQLTISGERQQEQQDDSDQYYAFERSYGSFTRTFSLPDGADPSKASAELKNGVLRIVVGKRPDLQPRRISLLDRAKGAAREAKEKIIEVAESAKDKMSSPPSADPGQAGRPADRNKPNK